MANQIANARQVMRKAFEKDPEFKKAYEDNIACLLMDNVPGLKRGQRAISTRNQVAAKILDRIFSE